MNMDAKKRRKQRISQLTPPQQSWQDWREPPGRHRLLFRSIISLIIYILIWTIFQLDDSNAAKVQHIVRSAMNESFDYETMSSWYQTHIGVVPTFLSTYSDQNKSSNKLDYELPISGPINTIGNTQDGVIRITTSADRAVISIGRGLVQFVRLTRDNEWMVRVQYSNGVQAIYGGLDSVQVQRNDWLEKGATIGHTDILIFAIKKGEQYVNPGDVIPID